MAGKIIVLTTYGKDDLNESFSISLFDKIESTSYYSSSEVLENARNYCGNINALELKDGKWIYARIIGENEKTSLKKLQRIDIVNLLDDRSVQKVLRELDSDSLARALIGCNEEIKEKIFKNMSERAVRMLKEDMEALGNVTANEVKSSQEKMILIINHMIDTGELAFAKP
jgi:Mg/Co/Ni transporter MgtE